MCGRPRDERSLPESEIRSRRAEEEGSKIKAPEMERSRHFPKSTQLTWKKMAHCLKVGEPSTPACEVSRSSGHSKGGRAYLVRLSTDQVTPKLSSTIALQGSGGITGVITVGRGSSNSVQLESREVPYLLSREHAEFNFKDGKHYVTDKNVTNGTYKNGNLIPTGRPWELRNGDTVGFGGPRLIVINNQSMFNPFYYEFRTDVSSEERKKLFSDEKVVEKGSPRVIDVNGIVKVFLAPGQTTFMRDDSSLAPASRGAREPHNRKLPSADERQEHGVTGRKRARVEETSHQWCVGSEGYMTSHCAHCHKEIPEDFIRLTRTGFNAHGCLCSHDSYHLNISCLADRASEMRRVEFMGRDLLNTQEENILSAFLKSRRSSV